MQNVCFAMYIWIYEPMGFHFGWPKDMLSVFCTQTSKRRNSHSIQIAQLVNLMNAINFFQPEFISFYRRIKTQLSQANEQWHCVSSCTQCARLSIYLCKH